MKTIHCLYVNVVFFAVGVLCCRADVIGGPVTNPSNGHDYYLLLSNSWTESEAEAENLGGTLAVINDAEEQKWVFGNFGSYGGVARGLWIGLHRDASGKWVWINGDATNFVNWGTSQPDNAGGNENCAHMWQSGTIQPAGMWNDAADASLNWGVVEMPHRTKLSKRELELIGAWYEGGRVDRPCWIAGAEGTLFVISSGNSASRAILCKDGTLSAGFTTERMNPVYFGYSSGMQPNSPRELRGEIIEDKILWNNGTWWSRKIASTSSTERSGQPQPPP